MIDLEPLLAVSDAVWETMILAVVTITLGAMQYMTQKKLDKVSRDVAVVHLATNSIVQKLMDKTEVEAHARGEYDQRQRDKDDAETTDT